MARHSLSTLKAFLEDPVVAAAIAVNGAILLLNLFPLLGPNTTGILVESYALVPITVLAMIAPWIGLPPPRSKRETAFWALWTLSLSFHLVVRILYIVVPDVDSIASGSVAVDILYVLFYLPLVLSLLIRPDWPWLESEGKASQVLEFVGAGIFVACLLVYFTFIPRFFNQPEYETWVPSLVMYWILDLYLLITLLYLWQTAPSRRWRVLYTWLALAAGCWGITDFMELNFYREWDGSSWSSGPKDVLWYIPWIAITLAGRMRDRPFPAVLGIGGSRVEDSELSRSLGRPGWLQLTALALPLVHITANGVGLLDPGTEGLRETVVLVSLILLLGISVLHQKMVEDRALDLARRGRALEKEQQVLAAAVEQSPDAILITDEQGVVRYANQEYAELFGPIRDVLGKPLLEVIPRAVREAPGQELPTALAEGRAWEGKVPPMAGDPAREELMAVSPVTDSTGAVSHWVAVRRDVSYVNQLERQFRQARRVEAVGPLAAGFAHDFKAIVQEIYGHGSTLKEELSPGTSPCREVDELLATAERAAELVNQVLELTEEGEKTKEPVDARAVVEEALALLSPTIPASVRLVMALGSGGCLVKGHAHQIQQMVLNLGTNALQAMEGAGGILEVGLERVSLDDRRARELELGRRGAHVELTVRDTGRGIPRESLDHILDPFFTTKGPEKGSGLGLYLVRETVTGHDGAIQVESEPGWGTLFRIFLPCIEEDSNPDGGGREGKA